MNKTILLADDSVTIRKVVELTFMDESFDLISVGSGGEALDRFDASVDLVIADVHMPGANGYEVCEEVKKRSPTTPVLLLVGTFETYDDQRSLEAGADDHLKKPFDSQDLLGRVHGLLARSEAASGEPDPDSEPSLVFSGSSAGANVFGAAGRGPESESGAATTHAGGEVAEASAAQIDSALPSDQVRAAPGESESRGSNTDMSDESVDRIARRVVELLSEDALREVAWEVIPDLAEVVIKERLEELESQVE